ncbi:replication initiation protein [Campylobacter jejuni]|nr:RepB family plasmid replication initiator protein [Campylobacter jejuni]EAJ8686431.1 replication initiation protein [Campylobacter jejuni]EAL8043322.1 replication initiation protein [Campylobacter jejuni]ECK7013041.1 replication initiation protein [Campylobacter jejuni]ECZ3065552.1 replication initiation protein [Campylobacter jejuni]
MTKDKINNNLVYHNDLNCFTFKNFKAVDYNLFFTICYYASQNIKTSKNIIPISLSFEQLRDFLPQEKNKKRFYENVVEFALKLNNLKTSNLTLDNEGYRIYSVSSFFDEIAVNEKEEKIVFKIKEKWLDLIVNVVREYTILDLRNFCKISNKYTKNLYRYLSQWQGTGEFIIPFEKFNLLLDIPASYDIDKIEQRIIFPSIKLFKENNYFKNLEYIKEKDKTKQGQGGQVTTFTFTFDIPEERKDKTLALNKKWGRRRKTENIIPPPPTKRERIEVSF